MADGAIVPLLYEGRMVELEQNQAAIDIWFERHTQGLTDQQKADLKKKYARAEMLNKAEQVIYMRAFDISEHYRQNWQGTGFKAQLVAPNKAAALRYKAFLDELGAVTSEVIISPPDEREGFDEIDAEESADAVVAFWQRMMKRYGSEEDYNKQIVNAFKFGDEPEILIVVDKLLTGFDAPRNTVLYLARRLKDHSLLQAIARVNRLYEDESGSKAKDFGYVIDYVGVLAVEMFHLGAHVPLAQRIAVNEIAPRVHNSGHWTIEACGASQFANHIRAVAGWPIASTARHSDALMVNLIGHDADTRR